jgi:tRNA threonylcarbamoyladenosine biosynthesis protein TsaE
MREPELSWLLASEPELTARAGRVARRWRDAALTSICIGLTGALGSGKTAWARGMLRGLGFNGRVPSPTYTLIELYPLPGLKIVHVDLYRLQGENELEALGLRDYLSEPHAWLLVEWPERSRALAAACDLQIRFDMPPDGGRRVSFAAGSGVGARAVALLTDSDFDSSNLG